MKIKQTPEDFQVEELTDVVAGSDGPFALYRLEKCNWTTPDALAAVRRRWQLDLRRVSSGGLKDRHAHTVQYFSVFHGPRRRLSHQDVHVEYLGQVAEPYTSRAIRANRFQLTLRSLAAADVAPALQGLAEAATEGVPNYFDDQRFGSVSPDGQFVAREMVLGNYEQALRLAPAAPYEHDRAAQKKEKAILRDCWGRWDECKKRLQRSHARSLVDYLCVHPDDYRGALVRLRPELRGLYLSAYQSHLWNRLLARWLRQRVPAEQLITLSLRMGEVPVPRGVSPELREELVRQTLPLPTARLHLENSDPNAALMRETLEGEGISLAQLKLKGFREMFFSKGDRAAWLVPESVRHEVADDDLANGRRKLTLSFELPRGCYATMIVKRITAGL